MRPPATPLMLLAAAPLAALALTAAAQGQVPPKVGRAWYEEAVAHGFRIKPPKDWHFFPDERGNPNVLGRYLPKRGDVLTLAGGGHLRPAMWLLVFDRDHSEPQLGLSATRRAARRAAITAHFETLEDWIRGNALELGTDFPVRELELLEERSEAVKGTLGARQVLYRGALGGRGEGDDGGDERGEELHLWATVYSLTPRKDVALLFSAPCEKRAWGKWRAQLKKIARTFARIDLELGDYSAVKGGGLRAQKHRRLLDQVRRNPGWELYATPSYFVISNSDDREFVQDVQLRLEAIRAQFEREFPAEKAIAALEKRVREEAAERAARDAQQWDAQTGTPLENPLELSRCSVVRLCDSKEDYHKFGGPQGSTGYWWAATEELVLYDDRARGGRRSTWAALHHEAFHQFLHYFFGGSLHPATWYNEGNADFYSGCELSSRKTYDLGRFDLRNAEIKEQIRQGRCVPLRDLVTATKAQYYGQLPLGGEQFSRYPHGWSLVYFLRTGARRRAKHWNEAWDGILDTYLDVLIETGSPRRASERAFEGVDWEELERAWEQYILKGR